MTYTELYTHLTCDMVDPIPRLTLPWCWYRMIHAPAGGLEMTAAGVEVENEAVKQPETARSNRQTWGEDDI